MFSRAVKSIAGYVFGVLKVVIFLLGAQWTLYNAAIRVYPEGKATLDSAYSWLAWACLVVGWTWYLYHNRRLNSVEILELGNNSKLTVKFGDIRKKFGNRLDINFVIPVNDFFDTELDSVVSRKTIHGQFLEWCLETRDRSVIDRLLSKRLKRFSKTRVPQKINGKKDRYEANARVCLELAGNHFYLIPTAETDPITLHAQMRWEEYPKLISRLCDFVREQGNGRTTIVPLIGDQFGRSGLPADALLQQLVVSVWRADRATNSIGSSLEIVLYDQNRGDFNLRATANWSKEIGLS